MSVEFNEPLAEVQSRRVTKPSFLTRMVLATGIVKTPQGAQVVLLILTVLLLMLTIFLFRDLTVTIPSPTEEQIIGPRS